MNRFGGVLGNVVGSVFGNHPRWSQQNTLGETLGDLSGGVAFRNGMLLGAALRLIQQNGGLDGVLARLHDRGLGAEADSWVGTGPNLAVTTAQLEHAFGTTAIDRATAPLELPVAEAGEAMSRILPELVNQFTPDGQMAPNHAALIPKALAMLSGAGA